VIGRIIGWLFVEILVEWMLGGIMRFIYGVGLRAYSIFTGEWSLTLKELREKHDASIRVYLLGGLICLCGLYFGLAWVINHT
jgi:hypothetical protein